MKSHIAELLTQALEQLHQQQVFTIDIPESIHVERTKDSSHGDYASNIAMQLAKQLSANPRSIAEKIVKTLPQSEHVEKAEIAGPGFINFFLNSDTITSIIPRILDERQKFGRSNLMKDQKLLLEYVSTNPTGPLHVGHGRGAAIGDTIANLASAVGYNVHREYYVNDAGRQMDILTVSIWCRYLEICGVNFHFPRAGYQGHYINDIAAALQKEYDNQFHQDLETLEKQCPPSHDSEDNKDSYVDAFITAAKTLLGDDKYQLIHGFGLQSILTDICDDLQEFNVHFDEWFSEKALFAQGGIEKAIAKLTESGYVYEQDGAKWFKSTAFGDDKDRVLVRENGCTTYFAPDVAYHMNKYDRGFDKVVDVFGADHHGYVARLSASIKAMRGHADDFQVVLVQFATLYRGKEKVQMSTRSGSFITLRELREEVGNDAARFFYVMRKSDQHMDFDLELAKSQSSDNPLYYIQYAHARICSVMTAVNANNYLYDPEIGLANINRLSESHEVALIGTLSKYPEIVQSAGTHFEPHLLAHYLRGLANDFHTYYNAHQFIVKDDKLRNARLCLAESAKITLANGLKLLGVGAPEQM